MFMFTFMFMLGCCYNYVLLLQYIYIYISCFVRFEYCSVLKDPLNALTGCTYSANEDPTKEENRPPLLTERQKRTNRQHKTNYGHRIFVGDDSWDVPWRMPQRIAEKDDTRYSIPGFLQEDDPQSWSLHAHNRAEAVNPKPPPPKRGPLNVFGTVPGSTFQHPKGKSAKEKGNVRTVALLAQTGKAAWAQKKYPKAKEWERFVLDECLEPMREEIHMGREDEDAGATASSSLGEMGTEGAIPSSSSGACSSDGASALPTEEGGGGEEQETVQPKKKRRVGEAAPHSPVSSSDLD